MIAIFSVAHNLNYYILLWKQFLYHLFYDFFSLNKWYRNCYCKNNFLKIDVMILFWKFLTIWKTKQKYTRKKVYVPVIYYFIFVNTCSLHKN